MSPKSHLYKLIDLLPESECIPAERFLEFLLDRKNTTELFAITENLDLDDPVTEEEMKESSAAWKDYVEGRDPGTPLNQALK